MVLGAFFIFGLIVLILVLKLLWSAFFGLRISSSDISAMRIPANEMTYIYEICVERQKDPTQTLTTYLISNNFFREKRTGKTKEQLLMDFFPRLDSLRKRIPDRRFNEYAALVETVLSELRCFPLIYDTNAQYMFGDTWSAKREMCGTKNHTGSDIFDRENIPGRIPVVSMTNGTIEDKGKNGRGGMYAAVRTERGSYYLYDNLEKLTELESGTAVTAGSLLGYMGNGGKADKTDVKGRAPANVHIGMKVKFRSGEIWLNPYPFLRFLEDMMYAEYL